MPITGYYDGSAVRVEEPLRINQRVIVIPVEEDSVAGNSVAGALRKYADPSLIEQEKTAWKKATVQKHE